MCVCVSVVCVWARRGGGGGGYNFFGVCVCVGAGQIFVIPLTFRHNIHVKSVDCFVNFIARNTFIVL